MTIDFDDIAGNHAKQVTAVTDTSSVSIDTLAPIIAAHADETVEATSPS